MPAFFSQARWCQVTFACFTLSPLGIGVATDGSNRTLAGTVIDTYGGGSLSFIQTSFEFLDSPNTTSATTYKVQVKYTALGGGSTPRINQQNGGSRITVMEIAG